MLKELFFIGVTSVLFKSLKGEAFYHDRDYNAINDVIPTIMNVQRGISNFMDDEFSDLEKRVKIFTSAMKRHYGDVNTYTTKILKEFQRQLEQMPKKNVPTRSLCMCEYQLYYPCPERCLNSCRIHIKGQGRRFITSTSDCTNLHQKWTVLGCECYYGSQQTCEVNGKVDMSLCYDKREEETACVKHNIEYSDVEKYIKTYSKLEIEGIKRLVRNLEFNVTSLYEWAEHMKDVVDTTLEFCQNESQMERKERERIKFPICQEKFSESLQGEMEQLRKKETQITQEMTDIENGADENLKVMIDFQDQIFAQINKFMKNYHCCLSKSTSQDVDCTSESTETIFNKPADLTPDSLCNERRCILRA